MEPERAVVACSAVVVAEGVPEVPAQVREKALLSKVLSCWGATVSFPGSKHVCCLSDGDVANYEISN